MKVLQGNQCDLDHGFVEKVDTDCRCLPGAVHPDVLPDWTRSGTRRVRAASELD